MLSALLLATSSAAQVSAQVPTQAPAQAPLAAIADFGGAAVAPGSWSYAAVQGGSEARFIDATTTVRLAIRCNRATRRVNISRISTTSAPALSLWTSTIQRSLPARFEANAFRVTAEIGSYDPLLDALAFSRGRIAVTMAGASPLVVPAWPEAARAVEDCRS